MGLCRLDLAMPPKRTFTKQWRGKYTGPHGGRWSLAKISYNVTDDMVEESWTQTTAPGEAVPANSASSQEAEAMAITAQATASSTGMSEGLVSAPQEAVANSASSQEAETMALTAEAMTTSAGASSPVGLAAAILADRV